MKNVITFCCKRDDANDLALSLTEDEARLYLRLQVDNSLRCGWSPNDILIYTDLEFSHREVHGRSLKDAKGGHLAFWCGLLAFFEEHPGEMAWVHDHDGWQLRTFDTIHFTAPFLVFPVNPWHYAGRTVTLFSSGSFFVRPEAKGFVERLVAFLKNPPKGYWESFNHRWHGEINVAQYVALHDGEKANFDYTLGLRYCLNHEAKQTWKSPLALAYCHCKLGSHLREVDLGELPEDFKTLMQGHLTFS